MPGPGFPRREAGGIPLRRCGCGQIGRRICRPDGRAFGMQRRNYGAGRIRGGQDRYGVELTGAWNQKRPCTHGNAHLLPDLSDQAAHAVCLLIGQLLSRCHNGVAQDALLMVGSGLGQKPRKEIFPISAPLIPLPIRCRPSAPPGRPGFRYAAEELWGWENDKQNFTYHKVSPRIPVLLEVPDPS